MFTGVTLRPRCNTGEHKMPTQKHRVNVTLEDETYQVLEQLAQLRGCSRSALVREFLDASAPMMKRTALLLSAASTMDERAVMEFQKMLEDAEGDLLQSMSEIIDDFESRKHGGKGH
jgi:uncharacterized protein (DUF1778 family)